MKHLNILILAIGLVISLSCYAIGGWRPVSQLHGVWILEAEKGGACLWVSTSKNGRIVGRYQVVSKRKGERIKVYQSQKVTPC